MAWPLLDSPVMNTNEGVIVVGLDRSEADHGILSAAMRIAKRTNAKLLLVHAAPVPAGIMEAITSPIASLEPTDLDEAQTYLDAVAKRVPPELLADTVAGYGAAWSSLCDVAAKHGARLIVIGARGFRRTHALGTTATAVANHSPCSVYVTRDKPGRDTERILVGLDGSELSRHVLDAAATLASGERRRLLLFRAIEDAENAATKAELDVFAASVQARVPTTVHVRVGFAWRSLCDAARDYDVDVIAIGAHGHGAVKRVLGTTAARVVEHADRSVLIVKRQSST